MLVAARIAKILLAVLNPTLATKIKLRSSAEIKYQAAYRMDKIATFEDISVLVFKEGDRSLQVPICFGQMTESGMRQTFRATLRYSRLHVDF